LPSGRFGIVEAADADAAIKKAVEELDIKEPLRQQRLIAVRRPARDCSGDAETLACQSMPGSLPQVHRF
jgi:hypothetical protein